MESSDRLKLLQLAMEEDDATVRSSRSGLWEPPSETYLDSALPSYQVTRLIAVGGMGAVYEAVDKNGEKVAIKIMPPEFEADALLSSRFESEAKILTSLDHEHIVSVLETGRTDDGLRYIVMEFLSGGCLRGQRTLAEALEILFQICDGLAHAHRAGIVHRDLKPSNILFSEDGRVKLVDFGLAKKMVSETDVPSLTLTGAQLGTPHYMAPECLMKNGVADERSDVYSLGVLFYQLLTGQLPVGKYEKASKQRGVPGSYDAIINRAMAPNPRKRYGSVEEFRLALKRAGIRKYVPVLAWIVSMIVVLIGVGYAIEKAKLPNVVYSRETKETEFHPLNSTEVWGPSMMEEREKVSNIDFVAGSSVRLVGVSSNQGKQNWFKGRSLRMEPGSRLSVGNSGGSVKVDRLILDGGEVELEDLRYTQTEQSGRESFKRPVGMNLSGGIEVESFSLLTRKGPGNAPKVAATLKGDAPLMVGGPGASRIYWIDGENSGFSGGWFIHSQVVANSPSAMGTGGIRIEEGALVFLAFKEPSATTEVGPVSLSELGVLEVKRDIVVASLSIDGREVAPGEYGPESELADEDGIILEAVLTVQGVGGDVPSPWLQEVPVVGEGDSELEAMSDGEWKDWVTWGVESSSLPRIPMADSDPLLGRFRIPEGRTVSVGEMSSDLQFFRAKEVMLEKGGRFEFCRNWETLVVPNLRLSGGTIVQNAELDGLVSVATLAGNLIVEEETRVEFAGRQETASQNYRMVLEGKLIGNGDVILDGTDAQHYLMVGADTTGYSGKWVVRNGTLSGLAKQAFEKSEIHLSGSKSRFGNLRNRELRVKRIVSENGGSLLLVSGDIRVNEWIHEGEPVAPGVYDALDRGVVRAARAEGKVIVGFDTVVE